jgi:hypothetical protein
VWPRVSSAGFKRPKWWLNSREDNFMATDRFRRGAIHFSLADQSVDFVTAKLVAGGASHACEQV